MHSVRQLKRFLFPGLVLVITLALVIIATRRSPRTSEFQNPANLSEREIKSLAQELGELQKREQRVAQTTVIVSGATRWCFHHQRPARTWLASVRP